MNRWAVKRSTTRGVWGHAPPENFEILVLWNAISSVLRGQILSKCSLNQLSFLCLFLYKLCGFWNCSGYHFQLSILCVVSLYEYHKNLFENFRTTVCRNLKFSYPERILIGIRVFREKSEGPRRFFLTYFLRTSFKFFSMQSVECALKTR